VFGIGLYNAEGVTCYGTNTAIEEFQPEDIRGDGLVTSRLTASIRAYLQARRRRPQSHHRPYDYHPVLIRSE
jgi:hypothetical protein